MCSPPPVPLRWHMGVPRDTDIPSTPELQQMPALGREEWLGLHMEISWEETGTRWVVQKKNQKDLWMIISMEIMAAQRSHTLLACTSAAGGGQGEERSSWGGSSAPSLVTAFQNSSEGRKGAPEWASLDPGCRSWETSKMSLSKVLGSEKIFVI